MMIITVAFKNTVKVCYCLKLHFLSPRGSLIQHLTFANVIKMLVDIESLVENAELV